MGDRLVDLRGKREQDSHFDGKAPEEKDEFPIHDQTRALRRASGAV